MRQHDQKQRQILQDAPSDSGVSAIPRLDFVDGDEKPGPMKENIDADEAKQMDGTTPCSWHGGRLLLQGRLGRSAGRLCQGRRILISRQSFDETVVALLLRVLAEGAGVFRPLKQTRRQWALAPGLLFAAKQGPGLKATQSIPPIQRSEDPCSLQKHTVASNGN